MNNNNVDYIYGKRESAFNTGETLDVLFRQYVPMLINEYAHILLNYVDDLMEADIDTMSDSRNKLVEQIKKHKSEYEQYVVDVQLKAIEQNLLDRGFYGWLFSLEETIKGERKNHLGEEYTVQDFKDNTINKLNNTSREGSFIELEMLNSLSDDGFIEYINETDTLIDSAKNILKKHSNPNDVLQKMYKRNEWFTHQNNLTDAEFETFAKSKKALSIATINRRLEMLEENIAKTQLFLEGMGKSITTKNYEIKLSVMKKDQELLIEVKNNLIRYNKRKSVILREWRDREKKRQDKEKEVNKLIGNFDTYDSGEIYNLSKKSRRSLQIGTLVKDLIAFDKEKDFFENLEQLYSSKAGRKKVLERLIPPITAFGKSKAAADTVTGTIINIFDKYLNEGYLFESNIGASDKEKITEEFFYKALSSLEGYMRRIGIGRFLFKIDDNKYNNKEYHDDLIFKKDKYSVNEMTLTLISLLLRDSDKGTGHLTGLIKNTAKKILTETGISKSKVIDDPSFYLMMLTDDMVLPTGKRKDPLIDVGATSAIGETINEISSTIKRNSVKLMVKIEKELEKLKVNTESLRFIEDYDTILKKLFSRIDKILQDIIKHSVKHDVSFERALNKEVELFLGTDGYDHSQNETIARKTIASVIFIEVLELLKVLYSKSYSEYEDASGGDKSNTMGTFEQSVLKTKQRLRISSVFKDGFYLPSSFAAEVLIDNDESDESKTSNWLLEQKIDFLTGGNPSGRLGLIDTGKHHALINKPYSTRISRDRRK